MAFKIDDEKAKGLKFRLKIFLWYLCTEPYRQLWLIVKYAKYILIQLNKTLTWAYLASIFLLMALLTGKKFAAALFLIFLLFVLLLWEWESGTYMYRHRQHMKKKYEKEKKEEIK